MSQHPLNLAVRFLRLGLEAALFGGAVWGLAAVSAPGAAVVLGGGVLMHYALSYDRIGALLRH